MADTAHTSLYRRFRPARFDELVGQDANVFALRSQVAAGRHGHAYLFSGPRGCGKTSAARVLAAALNCTSNPHGPPVDGEPCGQCQSCRDVAAGTSANVFEIDAASNSSVDAMRQLLARVPIGSPGRRKVYVLDECHMLSPAAAAALLKTLEEPPAHVVFVLATTNPEKLPSTIASRALPMVFHLVPAHAMHDHLTTIAERASLDVSADTIASAVAVSGGSVRDALSALEASRFGSPAASPMTAARQVVLSVLASDVSATLVAFAEAATAGFDVRELLAAITRTARDWFLVTQGAASLVTSTIDDEVAAALGQGSARVLVRLLETSGEVSSTALAGPDLRCAVEVNLVRVCRMDATATIADHHRRLATLEQRVDDLTPVPA